MLTILLLTIVLIGSEPVFGQENNLKIDQRLIDTYGINRCQEMLSNQPEFIHYMNFYVQNAYQIMEDVPARKLSYFEDISTITNTRTNSPISPDDLENLNILFLDIERKNDQFLTYKIGETGTVVVFIAPNNLLEQYNELKKKGGIE